MQLAAKSTDSAADVDHCLDHVPEACSGQVPKLGA